MAVAGASQYRYAAILANTQGLAAQSTDLVSSLGSVDMLDVARAASGHNGIGLSPQARQLNKQFLNSSTSNFNTIFSLGVADTATIDGLLTEINALRGEQEPEERITTGTEGSASFEDANGNKLSTRAIAELKERARVAEQAAADAQRAQEREAAVQEMLAKVRSEVGSVGGVVNTSA